MITSQGYRITSREVPGTWKMIAKERLFKEKTMTGSQLDNYRFQQKMRTRYPELTPYNLLLCTYVRANLSTREIASILNITPDSVKKAKHRLRKKLGMNPLTSWEAVFAQ